MKLLLFLCFPMIYGPVVPKTKISPLRAGIGSRIIGGQMARASQFPFVAAITASYAEGSSFCGGAIINNQWVLTAAQCIAGGRQFTVQMGSNLIEQDDPNRMTVITSSYVIHPEYNEDLLAHDVGLLRFRLPIVFNGYVSPITLPYAELADSAVVTVMGWGHNTDHETATLQNNLHFVELVTITNYECMINYGDQIIDEMVCGVGPVNEGICTGDSGGPLIEYNADNVPIHAAIATFVSAYGCESRLPSGFTRTNRYVDWINSVTAI